MKTENLAIILTDIVGYTEATSRLSRKEQKEMLNLHNQLLFPIIRNFGGKVVKTIGDALLLVFRSPTDAMLCSMAMQDALYDFNRKSEHGGELHIRIAASLGEVRVSRNDVFGEAVNLTSRIESITPEDEIYLSEAIYLAMNKAEVPCVEVGLKALKGISEPVRIWQIPRFTRSKLVPEDVGEEQIDELSYPYGGAHLDVEPKSGVGLDLMPEKKTIGLGLLVVALIAVGAVVWSLPAGTFSSLFAGEETPPIEQVEPKKEAEPPKPVVKKTPKQTVKSAPVKKVAKVEPKPELKPVVVEQAGIYAPLIAQLESGQGSEMRAAARRVANEEIFEPEVLTVMEKVLGTYHLRSDFDSRTADALAWYCKTLALSGEEAYLPILEQVAESSKHAKLKKYAARSLNQLRRKVR